MHERSHLMMRSKQDLKNELLMGFRKKNQNHIIDLQQSQKINKVCSTPTQPYQNRSFTQNNSILDEFSKCPLREDEFAGGETFLNKFMFTKKQIVFASSDKASVSVQTQRNDGQAHIMNQNVGYSKKKQAMAPKVRTPRVTDFDERADQSLIDISGNISTYKYPVSDSKNPAQLNQNRILSDSILGHQKKDKQNSEDSADQLLNQLENADDSFNVKRVQNQDPDTDKREPIIKKIQLLKPKNKNQYQNNNAKQNEDKNVMLDQVQVSKQNEKLERLLSKKSVIKSLIVNKNLQELNKQKQKVGTTSIPNEAGASKWSKDKKFEIKQKISQTKPVQQEEDPLDLLPPYETSSSGLQAVIEEQNESELEESIKNKKALQQVGPLPSSNKFGQARHQEVSTSQRQLENEGPQKRTESKFLKSISINDLSLQDVSQIENVSGNKQLPDSLKKLHSAKDPSEELPDYQDSQNQEKKLEQNVQIQKYIVSDIANDIKNLKKKISQDANCLQVEKLGEKSNQDLQKNQRRKPSSGVGSQGVDRKMVSMLDFFDEINDKLDFGQISRDINELRDRIANDSQ